MNVHCVLLAHEGELFRQRLSWNERVMGLAGFGECNVAHHNFLHKSEFGSMQLCLLQNFQVVIMSAVCCMGRLCMFRNATVEPCAVYRQCGLQHEPRVELTCASYGAGNS